MCVSDLASYSIHTHTHTHIHIHIHTHIFIHHSHTRIHTHSAAALYITHSNILHTTHYTLPRCTVDSRRQVVSEESYSQYIPRYREYPHADLHDRRPHQEPGSVHKRLVPAAGLKEIPFRLTRKKWAPEESGSQKVGPGVREVEKRKAETKRGVRNRDGDEAGREERGEGSEERAIRFTNVHGEHDGTALSVLSVCVEDAIIY